MFPEQWTALMVVYGLKGDRGQDMFGKVEENSYSSIRLNSVSLRERKD